MRLQAFLSRAGASPSRRKAEALISAGRVEVNGEVAELGSKVSPTDSVLLDGERVSLPKEHAYLLLNKPAGYLTTMSDEFGRPTVADLMPPDVPGLVPAGRLDSETTGLLVLTNDGDFANLVTHPSSEVEKEYELVVVTPKTGEPLSKLSSGPTLDDGPMLPPKIEETRRDPENPGKTTLRLTIHEGRNRIIRRACEAVGLELLRLERVRVGGAELGGLPEGEWREMTGAELSSFGSLDDGGGVKR